MKVGKIEVYGVIYKITNMANNKVYIGQTTQGFDNRYCAKGEGIERVYNYHISRRRYGEKYNQYLLNSIEKYGFENFNVIKVFDVAYSQEELDKLEIYHIKKFKSNDREYGYNFREGGEGGKFSDDSNLKNGKRIRCINDGEIYRSVAKASEVYNIPKSYINNTLEYKYLPEKYIRFSLVNKEGDNIQYCKFCGEEFEHNKQKDYCVKHRNYKTRLNIIRGNIDINGEFIGIRNLYKYEEIKQNPEEYINETNKSNSEEAYVEKNESEYKINLEIKRKNKENFLKENEQLIINLYLKYKKFTKVIEYLDYKGINNTDIKKILTSNNIEIMDWRFSDEYKSYNAVYKNNKIIKVFEFKHECRRWMVDEQLAKSEGIARNIMYSSINNGKNYMEYKFEDISKEKYEELAKVINNK